MAIDLTEWEIEVSQNIRGLNVANLEIAVRQACIRFCEQTWLWRHTLAAINVVEDTQDYTLTIPDALSAKLVAVPKDGVSYKEHGESNEQYAPLDCISEELKSEAEGHSWKYEEAPNPSDFWVDNINKKLHLHPIPTAASTSGLLVDVILRPSSACITVPDFLYDDHKETIKKGALSFLYGQKSRDYYDPKEQLRNEADFLNGVNDAKFARITGKTNKPLSFTIPFFAG